jgi:membrane protease YdiL (CAAX protease family)
MVLLVIFFVVCLSHRLINGPSYDVGVDELHMDTKTFSIYFISYLCLNSIVFGFVENILAEFGHFPPDPPENFAVVANFITQSIMLILIYNLGFVRQIFKEETKKASRKIESIAGSILYNFGITFPITFIASLSWNGILSILRTYGVHIDYDAQVSVEMLTQIDNIYCMVIFIITVVVVVPVVEEVLFRGMVYKFLKMRTHATIANVVTAFIFAALHFNIMAFLPLFVLSICLARIYEHHADIRESILTHALFNLFNVVQILSGLMCNGKIN